MVENVIIIGSGCAGLSAAVYTSREGFDPLVISGVPAGGQLELTTDVENYPGFTKISGPELIENMMNQAKSFGTRFVNENVSDIDFSSKPFKVTAGDQVYETKTIIVATGATAKMLGISSEQKFVGKGLSTCATCDGAFFRGKDVIVVGGGDTAMEDSFFLTRFAKNVTIVHRKDSFRASKIMQDKVLKSEKIKVIWNSTVEEIVGEGHVTGVKIKDTSGNASELKTDGLFLAIGHIPTTAFLKGKLKTDEQGYLITKEEVLSDIEGVYIAGDVADRFYRQAATAVGSGVKAALRVREYLQMHA